MAKKQTRNATEVDFTDEDAVLAAVAKDLDEDPEDLSVEEDKGLTSFGEGTVYRISVGKREWCVAENYDAARALALAVVTQDLESEPEMFKKSFLESHIDQDRLRRDLEGDVRDMAEEDLREMSDRDFWRTAEDYIDVPEEDDDGGMPDPEEYIEEVAEAMVEQKLKDPMEYLEDIYGEKEAVEQAIKIAGIDVAAAAEDAVDTDGWEHFLCRYDGDSHQVGDLVYWREN